MSRSNHSGLERYQICYYDAFDQLVHVQVDFTPTSLIAGITVANILFCQAQKINPNITYFKLFDENTNKIIFSSKIEE